MRQRVWKDDESIAAGTHLVAIVSNTNQLTLANWVKTRPRPHELILKMLFVVNFHQTQVLIICHRIYSRPFYQVKVDQSIFYGLVGHPWTVRVIMLATFLLTVIVDLTVAVQVGLVLAGVFFIYRVSTLTEFIPIYLKDEDRAKGIVAYTIYGSLFFAVVGKIENLILNTKKSTKVLIFCITSLSNINKRKPYRLQKKLRLGHTVLFGYFSQNKQKGYFNMSQKLKRRSYDSKMI